MTKRHKLEIIKDILEIVQNNRKIKHTPLLRKSNLSSLRFKEYYTELLEKDLIKEIGTNRKETILTNKGQRFLEKYITIVNFIKEFEL